MREKFGFNKCDTADQKTKVDATMAERHKAGCSKGSKVADIKEAKGILNEEQYAKFKAECNGAKDRPAAWSPTSIRSKLCA